MLTVNENIEYDLIELDQSYLFRSPNEFSQYIEIKAKNDGCLCMDVLIEYAELRGLEYSDIAKMVSESLKEKLRLEFQANGDLPSSNRLEFENEI